MSEKRPNLLLAMDPALTERVLSTASLEKLARCCVLLDREPIQSFADPHGKELLSKVEIIVSGWGCPRMTDDVLDLATGLQLIAHSAGSVKQLISTSFYERHITITHAADANAVPVAEFTLAAIIFANKDVFRFRDIYRADRSRQTTDQRATETIGNIDKVVGIIGASTVGRRVITLLSAMDLEVLVYDPLIDGNDPVLKVAELTDIDSLMSRSSVVSLHAPLLPDTRSMIDARMLSLMQDGATLINTARGAVVDQDALLAELRSRRLNAVLDVTFPEIPDNDSPLYHLPNVFLTPHIAGALGLEQRRLGDLVVEEVERYCRDEQLQHSIPAERFSQIA